jgi:hypothetical protein
MPSIQDVADQINARLDQISTNTADTAQNTADIRTQLIQANSTLTAGFANLSQGLFAILQVQVASLGLLDHNRKQNDTIICELEHGNELLCNIMRKVGRQLDLSEATLKAVERIEGIEERAHCCEAGDYDRHLEVIAKVERCCPPEPPLVEPCPDRCPAPVFRERDVPKPTWTPLPERRE